MLLANIGEWDRWSIPFMHAAAYDLRMLAVMADAKEPGPDRLAEAARIILKLFNACATDRYKCMHAPMRRCLHARDR